MKIEPVAYEAEGKFFFRIDITVRDNHDRPVRLRKRRFRTVQEARKWAAQAALRVQAGEKIARARGRAGSGDLTVAQVFEAVKQHLLETGVWRPSTATLYRRWWNAIDSGIGQKRFCRLTRADLERVRRLDEGNAAPRLLALLVRVWAVAAELGIPGAAMERPAVRVPLRSRVAFLTAEQAQAFLRALEPPYREIAVVLLETGARLGEVLALMPEDIDAANRTLRIAKTWTEAPRAIGPTKSGRVRVVPFDSALGRG